MKVIFHNKVWIREGTYDIETLKEIPRSYGWMNVKNKTVLDIGGCFGGFSHMALKNGAGRVICVEPEVGNFALMKRNLKGVNAVLINAAVSTCTSKTIPLYLTKGKSHGNYSTTEFRGRDVVSVKNINFRYLLSHYRPSVLKVDCEGCEWDILLGQPLPKHVKQIVMEIHFSKPNWRLKAKKMFDMFKDWECVKKPRVTEGNWHTIGGWKR